MKNIFKCKVLNIVSIVSLCIFVFWFLIYDSRPNVRFRDLYENSLDKHLFAKKQKTSIENFENIRLITTKEITTSFFRSLSQSKNQIRNRENDDKMNANYRPLHNCSKYLYRSNLLKNYQDFISNYTKPKRIIEPSPICKKDSFPLAVIGVISTKEAINRRNVVCL